MNAKVGSLTYSALTGMVVHTTESVPPGTMYVAPTSNQVFISNTTASQFRSTSAHESVAEKQEKPMSKKNTKAFEVTLVDGPKETVLAQDVVEADGRIKFTGFVEGVDDSYGNTVVKSFRAEKVDEYRVVPKPELDAKAEGKNTYRVNLTDGSHKDVKADHVLFQAGSGDKAGRYSLVTAVKGSESRTEYIVPEDKVDSVERLSDTGEATVLVDNKADASA